MSSKSKFLFLFVLMTAFSLNTAFAKTPASITNQFNWVNEKKAELSSVMLEQAQSGELNYLAQAINDTTSTAAVPFPLIKSPRKALLFSAVIPGAGELYAKSYIFAAAFLAVETTLWLMYNKYQKKGEDLENEFEDYADDHWRLEIYEAWLGSDEAVQNGLNEESERTHTLPRDENTDEVIKTQQYYEMIGKYNQFYAGWDDSGWSFSGGTLTPDGSYSYSDIRSPVRLKYMDMREDSNIQLKNATTMVSIVILNHIVSAVDAAWASYRYNKNYAKKHNTSLRLDTIRHAKRVYPALSFSMRW